MIYFCRLYLLKQGWSASSMPKRILSTSRDATVLRTRNLVLQSAGYEVVAALDSEQFMRLLEGQSFDLVVLGDSIEVDERINLARKARASKPDVPLIIFFKTPAEAQRLFAHAHTLIGSLEGPERLIAAVRAAVGDDEPPAQPKPPKT
jgi:DNA-binding response OmpR family regulator